MTLDTQLCSIDSQATVMNTYFTGVLSSRRPVTLITGLVLMSVGICFSVIWLPQMLGPVTFARIFGALCSLIIIVVLLSGGSFLVYKFTKDQKTILTITSEGLSYGEEFYAWKNIEEIGIVQKYTGREDLYCTTRLHGFAIELPLSKGLHADQIELLFSLLQNEVVEQHSHLCLSR